VGQVAEVFPHLARLCLSRSSQYTRRHEQPSLRSCAAGLPCRSCSLGSGDIRPRSVPLTGEASELAHRLGKHGDSSGVPVPEPPRGILVGTARRRHFRVVRTRLKPSYGRVSHRGVIPLSPTLAAKVFSTGARNLWPNFCPPELTSADVSRLSVTQPCCIGRSRPGRQRLITPEVAGSNPAPATRKAPEAGLFCAHCRDRLRKLLPNFCLFHSPVILTLREHCGR